MSASEVWRDPQPAISYPLADSQPLVPLSNRPVVVAVGNSTGGVGFSVNLETSAGDIAIHVNPRFLQGATAVNNLAESAWGYEHTCPMLTNINEQFVCKITADGSNYEVYINSKHLMSYHSRTPCSAVTKLTVYGDATLRGVTQCMEDCVPEPY
ncbi:grifin-like [Ornithodoros turicata]|uniref:grifin-like n=1 Tax=Ornithodoros turicata TaxID=34597 RepID=UPI00313902BF